MSRRRRNRPSNHSNGNHGRHDSNHAGREARPAETASYGGRERPRERDRDRPLVDHSARYGVQGAGHPPADAPFAERMAPYAGLVDSALRHAAAALHGNVDVSFMHTDFERFVCERMLVVGMGSLLARSGKGRGTAALEILVAMVEGHQDGQARRNGHHNGNGMTNGHHRAVAASIVLGERG